MDVDDKADVFAIVALAGTGLALMLVGTLDIMGVAIVLAVVLPALAAVLAAVVSTIMAWSRARRGTDPRRVQTTKVIEQPAVGMGRRMRTTGTPHRESR